MRQIQDTAALRNISYASSNTNTVTVTINAVASERHIIDQVIWSTDATPVANSAVTVTNVTDSNAVVSKWNVTATGPDSIAFTGGLPMAVSSTVTVVLVANAPVGLNHVTVLYR
jgi:hypothetical protein